MANSMQTGVKAMQTMNSMTANLPQVAQEYQKQSMKMDMVDEFVLIAILG